MCATRSARDKVPTQTTAPTTLGLGLGLGRFPNAFSGSVTSQSENDIAAMVLCVLSAGFLVVTLAGADAFDSSDEPLTTSAFLAVVVVVILLWLFGSDGILDRRKKRGFRAIGDNFKSLSEVQQALRAGGLESSNLIIGIDYTRSNEWNGEHTFGGKCLHALSSEVANPYEQVIRVIGRTLMAFDDDNLIPTFGFGDASTTDKTVFPFFHNAACEGVDQVLSRYREITPTLALSGPTSFAPLIYEAINVCVVKQSYHILLIIADGQVVKEEETVRAIEDASRYPLSVVMIGVGDGPWDKMKEFDDALPQRVFDNFQFVNFNEFSHNDAEFAMHALMEIPEQFNEIRRLGLLDRL